MSETVIKVENVGMEFKLNQEKVDNLKEYVIKFIKRDLMFHSFWALKDISFEVEKGDVLGIIGLNGAGKSTLLKIIAGVIKPKEGKIKIKGRISPLLAIGAGFDPDYTGRENIFLNGALLGYSKQFLESIYDEIVKFSEIEDFIDVPLKNYSSGMRARLGFSIATMVEPEILILDEVLSVGDAKFQEKSQKRMKSLLNSETTVLFVSHSINQVKNLCNKVIWLEKGEIVMQGPVDEVCDAYIESIHSKEPFITYSDPYINEKNVSVNKLIKITFNRPIKTGTNWIEVLENGIKLPSTAFMLSLSSDSKTLTIKPSTLWATNTLHKVILHTGCVKDFDGNNLAYATRVFETGNI